MPDKTGNNPSEIIEEQAGQGVAEPIMADGTIGSNEPGGVRSDIIEIIGKTVGETESAANKTAKPRELSAEQQEELISILRARFDQKSKKLFDLLSLKNDPSRKASNFFALKILSERKSDPSERSERKSDYPEQHEQINFTEVEKALKANPALMLSLYQMEEIGGEPDIISVERDAFIFGECSEYCPDCRRDSNYYQVEEKANESGVEIMSKEIYYEMHKGRQCDIGTTFSWVKTPDDIREAGQALAGRRAGGRIIISLYDALSSSNNIGWRGMLRVPRIPNAPKTPKVPKT